MEDFHRQGQKIQLYLGHLFGWEVANVAMPRLTGLVFLALDAVRLRLSHLPPWVQVAGALLILVAMYAFYRTFRENSFAAAVVKIQKERGHTVVTTGPYAIVRHPMYAGAGLIFFGVPMLLGSAYGLALAPAWYVIGCGALGLVAVAFMDERSGKPLD